MNQFWRLLAAFLFSIGILHGQSSDLEDLLLRYREARADTSTYLNTRSLSLKGQMTQGNVTYPFEVNQRQDGKIRLEVEEANNSVIQIFDGSEGWRWVAGKPEIGVLQLTPRQLRFFRLSQSFYSPLEKPEVYGFKVRYLGLKSEHESPEHHVRLASDQYGDIMDIWIDAKTFLENRRIYRPSEDAPGLVTLYLDYNKMDGLMTPFIVETKFQGDTLTRTRVESVKRNPGMLSFYFNKPTSYEIITAPAPKGAESN